MKRAFLFLIFCMALSAWAQNQTVNGLKQGPWKVAYEGSAVIRYEGQFDRGIPVGTFTHYHPNGTKRAVMVFRGKTQACYTQEFALNGVLLAEGLYGAPGVKDSTWRIYDLNGKLLNTETYQGGQLNGPFATYYPNGKWWSLAACKTVRSQDALDPLWRKRGKDPKRGICHGHAPRDVDGI